MTTKVPHQSFSFLIFLIIIILFLNISSYVCARHQKALEEFNIKHLAGHRKGDKVEGLNQIKNYLKKFGYIHNNNEDPDDDYFDDVLELAVKTYQSRHSFKSTGILDTETLSQMSVPRCGVPDYHSSRSKFSFFPSKEKWGDKHTNLTYAFTNSIPKNMSMVIELAFVTWSQSSRFTFTYTENQTSSDLKIAYQYIDGPLKKYAYGYAPTYGHVVFNDQELWACEYEVDKIPSDKVSLYSVALHEIGHLLGLDHSTVREATMWPYLGLGETKGLNDDDIQGIKTLYAPRT